LHKEYLVILDKLTNCRLYLPLHPDFAGAFEFLARPDLASLIPGKYEIADQRLFAIVAHDAGKGHDNARLEFHRRYIDIQYVVSGVEHIGWREVSTCGPVSGAFDEQKDIVFCDDRPQTWLTLPPHHFAILYPHDAHAPLAGEGPVHKVVVKVAV
jgi:YhcH/YjgK/YiaL family protein